jgi:hypothetical protein
MLCKPYGVQAGQEPMTGIGPAYSAWEAISAAEHPRERLW